jgi:hypothetical protein
VIPVNPADSRFPDDLGFSFRATKQGEVRIERGGRVVTVLRGEAARRLLARLEGAGSAAVQQALARVTGNYRRGNEGSAGARPGKGNDPRNASGS